MATEKTGNDEGMFSSLVTLTNHVSDVTCLASNHRYVVSGSLDRTVRVFRLSDFGEVTVLTHHTYHVRSLDFSPCGRYLATCSSDSFAMVFDTETNAPFTRVGQCQHPSCCDLRVVTFAVPQGERIATAGDDGSVCVWGFNPSCAPELRLLVTLNEVDEAIHACRFVPHHDDLLIAGSSAGDLRLWRLFDNTANDNRSSSPKLQGKCHLYLPTAHDLGVTSMDVISRRDDPTLLMATGGHDNVISLWAIEPKPAENPTLRLLGSRRDHSQSILSLKFTRHDSSKLMLASTSIETTVVIYAVRCADINAGQSMIPKTHELKIIQRISDHSRYVNCATFSPDASLMFTGSNDHTVRAYGRNVAPRPSSSGTGPIKQMVVALPPVDGSSLRKMISQTSSNAQDSKYTNCPPEFICPITQELMTDPVIACDGYTYEREAINNWFKRGEVASPMTNATLSHTTLIPNLALRSVIQHYLDNLDSKSAADKPTSNIQI